tara:strand:- start:1963 stop:2271 length:309 start_codon:yes stop_codon:yes gene_type:complete
MVSILFAEPIGIIKGNGSIGGEMINSLCVLFSFIYSLNIISIFSALKFVEKFSGSDLNTIGGSVSISPPVGVPRLAQLSVSINIKKENLNFTIPNSSLQSNA